MKFSITLLTLHHYIDDILTLPQLKEKSGMSLKPWRVRSLLALIPFTPSCWKLTLQLQQMCPQNCSGPCRKRYNSTRLGKRTDCQTPTERQPPELWNLVRHYIAFYTIKGLLQSPYWPSGHQMQPLTPSWCKSKQNSAKEEDIGIDEIFSPEKHHLAVSGMEYPTLHKFHRHPEGFW